MERPGGGGQGARGLAPVARIRVGLHRSPRLENSDCTLLRRALPLPAAENRRTTHSHCVWFPGYIYLDVAVSALESMPPQRGNPQRLPQNPIPPLAPHHQSMKTPSPALISSPHAPLTGKNTISLIQVMAPTVVHTNIGSQSTPLLPYAARKLPDPACDRRPLAP